mgnify:CR=1 FL=1
MEYPVGVEMSNTYLSFEVTSAALNWYVISCL